MFRILAVLGLAIGLVSHAILAQEAPRREAAPARPDKASAIKVIAVPSVQIPDHNARPPVARPAGPEKQPWAGPAEKPPIPAACGPDAVKRPGPEIGMPPSLAWHKRATYRLKHAPVVDVARAVKELFPGDSGVLVVPEPVSNTLLISAVPGALEEVVRLAESLDRAPVMVSVELLIAQVKSKIDDKADASRPKGDAEEVPAGDLEAQLGVLKKRGQVEVLCRPVLATTNQCPACLQVARREPRVTGSAVSRTGQVNSTTLENVGMRVSLTPRVGEDKTITMEIDVEDSRLGPLDEGTPVAVSSTGDTVRTPRVEILQLQSTVSMRSGQTVLLGRRVERSSSSRAELVVFVTANLIEPEKGSGDAKAPSRP